MQKIARISAVDRITERSFGTTSRIELSLEPSIEQGMQHIPERDAVGEEKSLFLIDRVRNRNVQDSGQGFPEAVLRMMVEKMSFPGFDGRERSEDQDL